jgi:hypothetical protein
MPDKTPEEIAADNDANREQREQIAREANKKRNDALLEARNAIADRADEIKDEEDDLVDLTDEVWAQEDGRGPKKTREQLIAEQDARDAETERAAGGNQTEEEAAAALLRQQEAEDRAADAARDAGASDSRRRKDGVMEYRVEGDDGTETWLTVKELRARAGDVDSGQGDGEGATTHPTRRDSPTAQERERLQAEAEQRRQAERKVLRDKLIDLNTRASMGDETAINELADMQLDAITGDSGRIQRMVDERVDARVTGRTEFQKAVDWFESEAGYADVLTTPRLKAEAGRLDAALAQEHPDWTPRQRLERVGKDMRQLREDLGGAPRGTPPPRRETKVDRKRNAPQVPQAAGRQRPEVEPDEQESTADAIARMARSRGQAHAIKH